MATRHLGEYRDEIERQVSLAPSLVLYLDLDSTLASTGPPRHPACTEHETRTELGELSRLDGVLVCVMSGRPVAELKEYFDIPGLVHGGDHGLEVDGDAFRFVHPEVARSRAQLVQLNERLLGLPLLVPGVEIEPRALATAVKFEPGSPEVRDRLGKMVQSLILAEQLDLRVMARMSSLEIRPRLDWNEAAAMAWIHQRIKTRDALGIVIGGESSEESVFRAIPGAITVQVGPAGPMQARYLLDGPDDVPPLLGWVRDLWTRRLARADPAWPSAPGRPVLALKEASPILNVRLRRAAIGRRRQMST